MITLRFKTNINCGSCIKSVTPALNQLDAVDEWKVDTENLDKILEIESEQDNSVEIINAVKNAGFNIERIL